MTNWPSSSWRSLRFRLIGWYLLLLVLTLALFSTYIFIQFHSLEQNQQDTNLQATSVSIRGILDFGPSGPNQPNSSPHFRSFPGAAGPIQELNRGNYQVRVIDQNGRVLDSLGTFVSEMPLSLPTRSGFDTLVTADNSQWRILNQGISTREGNIVGWFQVGQPVILLNTELGRLFTPILLGTIIALLLAVLGGLFLANQALRPIDRVTRTARSISTHDLSRRITYNGPDDEIGRLSKTIDQMLDRLEKGFEQERRFTSDASHELRTPLTALKGRIEVTLNQPRTPQEYQDTLNDLNHEVNRLIRLSSSLLYLARLDQNDLELQTEVFDLSELLDSIKETMVPVAELKKISLTGNIPTGFTVQGNLDQLTRLFLNLIDNAIKYTPPGGNVFVKLERVDKMMRIVISDTGQGISAEHLPHLFERFYRAQSDRASASGGAGLGLAIANEIARQHGGSIEIESQPGQGIAAKVLLPLQTLPQHQNKSSHAL